jgi:hypothetical protein
MLLHLPPVSRILPVPKSVIFMRKSSSNNIFSGFRSLTCHQQCLLIGPKNHPPMNDAFGMHVVKGINNLCGIILSASRGQRAQLRYQGLHFSISGKVNDKICRQTISVCLRFTEKSDGHTQAPLILESPEQSNNPRVSTPKPHESILLSERDGRFVFLDEVGLLENFDSKLLASVNVGCDLHLVCAMGW